MALTIRIQYSEFKIQDPGNAYFCRMKDNRQQKGRGGSGKRIGKSRATDSRSGGSFNRGRKPEGNRGSRSWSDRKEGEEKGEGRRDSYGSGPNRKGTFGGRSRSFGDRDSNRFSGKRSWSDRKDGEGRNEDRRDSDRSHSDRKSSYGDRSRSFGDRSRSFGDRDSDRSRSDRKGSYGDRSRSFGDRSRSFGDRDSDRSHSDRKGSNGDRSRSFGDRSRSFGDRDSRKFSGKRSGRSFEGGRDSRWKKGDGSDGKLSWSRNAEVSQETEAEEVRLNRFIASSGICSRREADKLIEQGLITINGEVITQLGTKVKRGDEVRYGGEKLQFERFVYLILNKPKDYITTADDPGGRKKVTDLIGKAVQERIYPVGRLDRQTTGLLMFTNDGELAKRLTHPKHGVKKVYHVVTDKPVTKQHLDELQSGIELEDGMVQVDQVAYVGDGLNKKEIGVELHSGKNRVVRRMFAELGYDVVKLDRVAFAGLTKKRIARGKWRFLTQKEINSLKMIS